MMPTVMLKSGASTNKFAGDDDNFAAVFQAIHEAIDPKRVPQDRRIGFMPDAM
jgi:hypothetical protein